MLENAINKLIEDALKDIKAFPIYAEDKDPFVTYSVYPVTGGFVKQSQLEVKILSSDFEQILEIQKKINDIFDMDDRTPSIYVDGIHLRSSLSGGGSMVDNDINMRENTLIYIINWKES